MNDDLDKYRVFSRRAIHLAGREIADAPGAIPLTPSWLSFYLLYRAGVSVTVIAALVDVPRAAISRRLLAVMELMRVPDVWLRIETLAEEMGRADFGAGDECDFVVFPGPARLVCRTVEGMAR